MILPEFKFTILGKSIVTLYISIMLINTYWLCVKETYLILMTCISITKSYSNQLLIPQLLKTFKIINIGQTISNGISSIFAQI